MRAPLRALSPLPLLLLALLGAAGCKPTATEHLARGHSARYERRYDEALGEYRRALDLLQKDESPGAQVLKARVLRSAADTYFYEQRKVREAAAVYRELVEKCPEAPETLEARIILAELLRTYLRDTRGAIDALEGAIQRNPPQVAELHYQKAKLYFELADYAQAELEANKVVQRFTTSPYWDDALFLRGQALGQLEGRREEALRTLAELAERMPDSELAPHATFERGRLRMDMKEEERAIELWVEALKTHPDPSMVQAAIARLRRQLTEKKPVHVGKEAAFDRARPARSSAEAVGATRGEHVSAEGD
jgi:tetratricopeptide (TPR) repeat protein